MEFRMIGAAAAVAALMTLSPLVGHADDTLRLAWDEDWGGAESLDPISPNRHYMINDIIYSRLMREDDHGEPIPELATAWSASDDAMEWTIDLRDGVTFHGGTSFDAADVVYTFDRIMDPAIDSPVASVLQIIDHVEIIDDDMVKIVLSSPHADLPLLLLDYRIRMIPEGSGDTIAETGIGSGPFMLESFDPQGTSRLIAFPDYWEGAPKLAAVEVYSIPDSDARIQALLAGQIDMAGASFQQARLFQGNDAFVVQVYPAGSWQAIVFRTDTPPFDDPRVRKAIRIAADRQAFIDLVLGEGNGEIACDNPVWKGDPYRADIDCAQDIEGAKALLAEAGYPDGIAFDVYTSNLESEMVPIAEVYQQQVAPAGIKVNVVMAPADGYWSDVWMVESASITSWSERPADQILNEAYRSTSSWNETYYNNPDFDALLDRARSELDPAKRAELYGDAQRMLFEDGGSFIPYNMNGLRVVSSELTNIPGDHNDNWIRWELVTKDGATN